MTPSKIISTILHRLTYSNCKILFPIFLTDLKKILKQNFKNLPSDFLHSLTFLYDSKVHE